MIYFCFSECGILLILIMMIKMDIELLHNVACVVKMVKERQ